MQFADENLDSVRQPQVAGNGENLLEEDKNDDGLSMQMSGREIVVRRGSGRTPEKWEDKILNPDTQDHAR